MNSKRIVFLLLAVIVAGTTAFLARVWLQAERAAIAAQVAGAKPVAAPAVQVLVVRNALRTGQLIKPEDLGWQAWPPGALPQTYITEGTVTAAAIARYRDGKIPALNTTGMSGVLATGAGTSSGGGGGGGTGSSGATN